MKICDFNPQFLSGMYLLHIAQTCHSMAKTLIFVIIRNYVHILSNKCTFFETPCTVAKPARLLVMLCKYFCVHRPRKQSISKEMNNDNDLKFA